MRSALLGRILAPLCFSSLVFLSVQARQTGEEYQVSVIWKMLRYPKCFGAFSSTDFAGAECVPCP